jgi:hypothetical protein
LISDLLEIAAGEHENLDEPLMLGRQIGKPRRRELALDSNLATAATHAANVHRLAAIRA